MKQLTRRSALGFGAALATGLFTGRMKAESPVIKPETPVGSIQIPLNDFMFMPDGSVTLSAVSKLSVLKALLDVGKYSKNEVRGFMGYVPLPTYGDVRYERTGLRSYMGESEK